MYRINLDTLRASSGLSDQESPTSLGMLEPSVGGFMRNVCVIGAGTMGSGIAAHLANIGFNVTLLDQDADAIRQRLEAAKAARPPHFYLDATVDSIRAGSVAENLDWVREADWVCEAIIEKLDAKRNLFAQIEPLIREDAFVSTNTSGLQIALLTDGRSEAFKRKFLGTHFFNPPRYLKLLELIPTDETDLEIVQKMSAFLEDACARRVVTVKDTPGFIANRYGMWSMFWATHVAEKLGFSIEMVDAITGPFLGRPKSGSFRLNDLVGIDIMVDIAQNLIERCPHDPMTNKLANPKSIDFLMEKGWLGSKSGQGYYRKEGKQFLALDLGTFAYRETREVDLPTLAALGRKSLGERLREALQGKDEVGEYLREYLIPTLQYAVQIAEEVSHNVQDFDRVMRWGFGWEMGPFELIDAIGAENLGLAAGTYYNAGQVRSHQGTFFSPAAEPQYATIHDFPIIAQYPDINLRDLGDGVTAIALTTKMGTVTPTAVSSLHQILDEGSVTRFVLTSEAKVFSVGFDLKFFATKIDEGDFDAIDQAIAEFQRLNIRLRGIPGVAAVWGYCIGGGYELALGCSLIAASPETQIGLPEAKVGLIPGGAGNAILRLRTQDQGAKGLTEAVKTLALGQLSINADDARRYGYLNRDDVTVYHPDRLLMDAKALALKATAKPLPTWQPISGPLKGMIDSMQQELVAKGVLTQWDQTISDKSKGIFSRANSLDEAIQLEREAFIALCKEGLSVARIKHMLESGKPLRN